MEATDMDEIEKRTIRIVFRRLIPFLMVCYFFAYLDRVNVGFASLTMTRDLGLSATAYGLGAGIFFISYFLFEVPSNLVLERVGARRWIARIMLSWGLISGAMVFARGEMSFYALRFLLGAAEAGFFPGIIYFLGLWFPSAHKGRIITSFMLAIPLSGMIGSPISGLLLQMDGALGLKGWQWLFLLEALPTILLSFVVFFYLTDRPSEARWLPEDSKAWLKQRLDAEHTPRAQDGAGLLRLLRDPVVLKLSAVYFCIAALNYGFSFYAPQLLGQFDLRTGVIGYVLIGPSLAGALGMVLWGRHSDATGERRHHLALAALCSVVGLVGAGLSHQLYLTIASLVLLGFGVNAATIFWTIPTLHLSRPAAGAGIAAISSVGQFAGFVSPYIIGYLKQHTGSFLIPLVAVACIGLAGIGLLLSVPPKAEPGERLT